MIKRSMFVLAVPDVQASANWYHSVLGFEIQQMGDPGWRLLVADDCRIMIGECRDAMPAIETGDHSWYAYLVVDDVDMYWIRVNGAGCEIVKPVRSEPWGLREFGIRTIDGHRIMIGQEIA